MPALGDLHGQERAALKRRCAGAATLFLVPTQQSYDCMVDITIECRGRQTGNWKCMESITQTQFLLADPNAAVPKVIKASVAAFFGDVRATGLLGANCK